MNNPSGLKIAVLSGAAKNAGDFLIVRRSKALLEQFVSGCVLKEFPRNKDLTPHLKDINDCDCVVFAGGPGYVPSMYPEQFPLVKDLTQIKPPLFALGMGGYTPTPQVDGITFSESSRMLLDRLVADGFGLGCRDKLTEKLLHNNGYGNTVFTGCPAWYDLSKVGADGLIKKPKLDEIKHIAISDPALSHNLDAPKYLISELKRQFKQCDITLVFHRGWKADNETDESLAKKQQALVAWAKSENIDVVDISYSADGFLVYNECDLHIGYRVHAHLYNVSQRQPTYLIEEDGRGFGANDALNQKEHISIAQPSKFKRGIISITEKLGLPAGRILRVNHKQAASLAVKHVVHDVESGYPCCELSCNIAHDSFSLMKEHVSRLNQIHKLSYER